MNIEIREKDEERAVFVVDGVDDTFINTIRRICLVEIPTLAIEDVNIFKNDVVYISAEVTDRCIEQMQIVLHTKLFEFAACR